MIKISKVKNFLKTSALIASIGAWLYITSPKIWYLKYQIRKELKENLDNCLIETHFEHEDKVTTDIIDLMSGTISKKELHSLLSNHGYDKTQMPIGDDIWDKDAALHHAIRHIHEKLGNPKIQFKWDYRNFQSIVSNIFDFDWKKENIYEHTRARYNFYNNTMSIYNLDSVKLAFANQNYLNKEKETIFDNYTMVRFDKLSSIEDPQRLLFNNWIAELAHAFQNTQDGFFKSQIDLAKDFYDCWFDYDQTYTIKGMMEYQAHEVYEPEIIKSFISLYQKYADLSDVDVIYKMAKFYWWYFDKYKDYNQSQFWLEKAAINGKPEAANMLANRSYQLFLDNYNDYFVDKEKRDHYLSQTIHWLQVAIEHSDDKIYTERLIKLCVDNEINIDFAISCCIDILNNFSFDNDKDINISVIFYYLNQLYEIQSKQCYIDETYNAK